MTEPYRHDQFSMPDSFGAGLRAGLPVAVGYLPAAFAFGAAASALGFSAWSAGVMSAIVFSGANQVFLLAAIPAGMSIIAMIALTAIASLRHLLYGMVLRERVGGNRVERLIFAFGLTDEVFATALATTGDRRWRPGAGWLWGLAFAAWAAWTVGSVIGAGAGAALRAQSETAAAAMGFALPALFLALSLGAVRRAVILPMIAAGLIAAAAIQAGQAGLAIPLGALGCLAAGWRRR